MDDDIIANTPAKREVMRKVMNLAARITRGEIPLSQQKEALAAIAEAKRLFPDLTPSGD